MWEESLKQFMFITRKDAVINYTRMMDIMRANLENKQSTCITVNVLLKQVMTVSYDHT